MNKAVEKIKSNLKPSGVYYMFSQEEIDSLVRSFIKEKTGMALDLTIGYEDDDCEVFVAWNDNQKTIDAFSELEKAQGDDYTPLFLRPSEHFMNRDHIFSQIFDSDLVSLEFEEVVDLYFVFLPNALMTRESYNSDKEKHL